MFTHLSEPFPISKELNKVARYVSKLYPDFGVKEWWRTYPQLSRVSYHLSYGQYTIGGLYQDGCDVILVLNIAVKPTDYKSENKILEMGTDLVVKYLECIPLLSVNTQIMFKVTREDIPNV